MKKAIRVAVLTVLFAIGGAGSVSTDLMWYHLITGHEFGTTSSIQCISCHG